MAFGTLSSRLLGLLRESLLAAFFSRTVTDAWYVAFRLPNLVRRLFGEGSLGVSFIPVFIEIKNSRGEAEKLRQFLDGFWTLFFALLVTVSLLCIVFTEDILELILDPKYALVPGKLELTISMSRIMFGYIFLVCTYAFGMAILNAVGIFGLPAFAPTLFNLVLILATIFPSKWQDWSGQALSWGVVLGGILQLGILIPPLWKRGLLPRLRLRFNFSPVLQVLKSMGPALVGMAVLPVTALINTHFASRLGEGPISFISLADRVLELPLSLIAVSLGTALLPTLSELYQKKSFQSFCQVATGQIRLNLFLALPAALGIYVLAMPIVQLLFERGKFSPAESAITAEVLRVYAWVIVTSSMVRVLLPIYHAMKNTWFPAAVSIFCLVVHTMFAPILMQQIGLKGLNISTLGASVLNLLLLSLGLRFFLKQSFWKLFWQGILAKRGVFFVPFVGMILALFLGSQSEEYLKLFWGEGFTARLLFVFQQVSLGALIYLGLGKILKIEESEALIQLLWGKLKRKLGPKRAR
jgi:putative peptidoglycan lipid II flippase